MKTIYFALFSFIFGCTHSTESTPDASSVKVAEASSNTASTSGAPSSDSNSHHHAAMGDHKKGSHQNSGQAMGIHKKEGHKHKSYGHKKGNHKKGDHHHSADEAFFTDAKFGDLEVKAHDFLYLSGEPSLAAVKDMKAKNVQLYVDIRPMSEVSPSLVKLMKAEGIEFVSKPVFLSDGTVDFKAVDEVYALHKKYHDVGHVVGCTSGVRSSGWLTLHLIKHHKMSVEDGIKIGKKAYLTEALAENIRNASK